MLPFQTVRDSKMQVFQFKIISRILSCKENLNNWNITDDFCVFCGETETIGHLFYYSADVRKSLFKMLEKWSNTVLNLQLHPTITDVLFGKYFDRSAMNYVILYAKWYMYRHGAIFFFLHYIVDLKYNVVIENCVLLKHSRSYLIPLKVKLCLHQVSTKTGNLKFKWTRF